MPWRFAMRVRTFLVSLSALAVVVLGGGIVQADPSGGDGSEGQPPSAPNLSLEVSRPLCRVEPCRQDVTLAWSQSTEADGYELYRNGLLLQTFSAPTYLFWVDSLTGSGVTYTYQVRAISYGGSAYSNTQSYTTKADTVSPTAPQNFSATEVTVGDWYGVRLTWSASEDNVGVTEYHIHRISL